MRKKPMQGYNGQRKNNRFDGGGHHRSGGGHSHHHNHNRPRKNYGAMRERYLTQARDAMAGGDRVLAENFLQHADHCWRMMMEEGSHRPRVAPVAEGASTEGAAPAASTPAGEEPVMPSGGQLPAFITTPYSQPQQAPVDPATIQNWEERDA